MAEDKKIGLGVDSSAMESGLSKLKRQAESVASEMIKNSRSFSTSSKEVLKDIDEQIKALEKRNKLLKEQREYQTKSQFQAGAISEGQYKARMKGSGAAAESSSMTVKLLRELIDEIKSTSRDEIRADRQTVEKQIKASKTADQLSPKGDARGILKETVQRGIIGDVKEGEYQERTNFGGKFKRGVGAGAGMVAGAVTSRNEFAMIAGAMAAIPVVGMAMSQVGQTILGAAEELEKAQVERRRTISGGGAAEVSNLRFGDVGGFNMADRDRAESQYISAYKGGGSNIYSGRYSGGENVQQLMAIERARGVDRGTLTEMLGFQRYQGKFGTEFGSYTEDGKVYSQTGVGNKSKAPSVNALVAVFETYLDKTEQSVTVLPEILKEYTKQQSEVINTISTGVDLKRSAQWIQQIGSTFGVEGANLSRFGTGLRKGLGMSSNQSIQALQFDVLSNQMGGGASLWDIEKKMERSSVMGDTDYLSGMLSKLQTVSGGNQDMFERFIYNAFGRYGISKSDAERVAEKYDPAKDMSKILSEIQDVFQKEAEEKTGKFDYTKQVQVGTIEEATEKMEDAMAKMGTKVVGAIEGLSGRISGLINGL